MSNAILYVLIGFLFLLLVGAIIWLLIVVFNKKEDKFDNPIALNFLANMDEGYFIGEVLTDTPAKNNRHFLKIKPLDVDTRLKQDVPTEIEVIVEDGKLINIPKGLGISKQKNIIICLPKKAEDLAGPLKDTLFGKGLMWMAELDNYTKSVTDILREGNTRKEALLKDIGTGEISIKFLEQTKNITQDYIENILAKKDNKQSIGLPTHTSSNE